MVNDIRPVLEVKPPSWRKDKALHWQDVLLYDMDTMRGINVESVHLYASPKESGEPQFVASNGLLLYGLDIEGEMDVRYTREWGTPQERRIVRIRAERGKPVLDMIIHVSFDDDPRPIPYSTINLRWKKGVPVECCVWLICLEAICDGPHLRALKKG